MWRTSRKDQIPARFDENSLNHFWTWPFYDTFRKSYEYLAMTAIEKSDEIKRAELGERSHLISPSDWSLLPTITSKDELFKTFDARFLDQYSQGDYLVPNHDKVHYVNKAFDPLFAAIDGNKTNNNDVESLANGILTGIENSNVTESAKRLTDKVN